MRVSDLVRFLPGTITSSDLWGREGILVARREHGVWVVCEVLVEGRVETCLQDDLIRVSSVFEDDDDGPR